LVVSRHIAGRLTMEFIDSTLISVGATPLSEALSLIYDNAFKVCLIYAPFWAIIVTVLMVSPLTIVLPQYVKGWLRWPWTEATSKNQWVIHGKHYDLTPLYETHPGGSMMLRTCRGSECTGLFESYHMFIDREKHMKMLKMYEIKKDSGIELMPLEAPESYEYNDDFHMALKEMVKDHFKGKPKGAHKMEWPNLIATGTCFVVYYYLIYKMIHDDWAYAIPFIGICASYLTFNCMHDASHGALVTVPWLNDIFAHAAGPYGVNVASWMIQHVSSHHIYTNDHGDVDLHHFPMFEFTGDKKSYDPRPFLAHLFMLFMVTSTTIEHLVLVVPYSIIFGHYDLLTGEVMYGKIKSIATHRAELFFRITGEFVGTIAFLVYSGYHMGVIKGFVYHMTVYLVASYIFTFFTQVSHFQSECFEKKEDEREKSWAKRQVASSMDFAPDSHLWAQLSGGLNTQAIHHVMPAVSAMHLRSLYPKFRAVCQKHNVELKENVSMDSFFWGYVNFAN